MGLWNGPSRVGLEAPRPAAAPDSSGLEAFKVALNIHSVRDVPQTKQAKVALPFNTE